jgi:hypothetical protein
MRAVILLAPARAAERHHLAVTMVHVWAEVYQGHLVDVL